MPVIVEKQRYLIIVFYDNGMKIYNYFMHINLKQLKAWPPGYGYYLRYHDEANAIIYLFNI